jgi:sugar lactone lactonase YvrE
MWVATGVISGYDMATGTPNGVVATGSGFFYDVTTRPGDPYLYTADATNGQILRFDPATGLLVDTFASGLSSPSFLEWRNDILYVSTGGVGTGNIRRFLADGTDLGDFVPAGLLSAPEQFAWDANGDLYVANKGVDDVVKYNGTTGALINPLFATGMELDFPFGLAFGPDGNLYVSP